MHLPYETVTDFNFKLFFELTPDLLCISGYDGYLKKINPAVVKLLGYTEEELFSRPINEFIYWEDRELTSRVREQLTKQKPLLNFENRYLTKTGDIVWLSWTSYPFQNEETIFAIAKNITEKKRLELERNELITNLTTINKDLKHYTYTTSHDLRSPVNNLLAIIDMIDPSMGTTPDLNELLQILKSSGLNLKETLNKYVDEFSKKNQVQANLELLSLDEILHTVLCSINNLIENSKVIINANFNELKAIFFNKPYLESIFLNLITNSIKYAQPHLPAVINISSKRVNNTNQLVFEDNGMGFDMEMVKDKIFGLHQRFHNHIDSKGIGLYLVHSHITNLGGNITVESSLNNGATFIISLPIEF